MFLQNTIRVITHIFCSSLSRLEQQGYWPTLFLQYAHILSVLNNIKGYPMNILTGHVSNAVQLGIVFPKYCFLHLSERKRI